MRDSPAGKVQGVQRFDPYLFVQHEYPVTVEKQRHSHPWLHLSVVQNGLYSRVERSHRYDFRPGSLAFLESNEHHTDTYARGSRCLHIVIPSDVERRLSRDFAIGTVLGEVLHEVAAPASTALQREFLAPSSSSPIIVEALLLDLVSRHLRIVCERSALRPIWMRSLMEYLNDTFEEDWTLEGLAWELGIHPVHLCRTFAQHQKCTLGAYIQALRIIRGRQLLELSSDSIANIATNCGFSDQSHFTRAFKTRFGIAPGAFRRNVPPAPKKYPAQR